MPVLADAVGHAAGALFKQVSRLRDAKSLHPYGVVHEATVTLDGTGPRGLLAEPGEHPALVRISRGAGTPEPLPDIMGLAVRLVDVHGPGRHQDLLMATSIDAPILHHLLVPTRSPFARAYTSLLPYRVGDDLVLIGALPLGTGGFELAVAPMLGRFRRIGEIRLGATLGDDANAIRFNPWNTGGGLVPAGWINRLRDRVYPDSQEGWAQ